MKRKYTPIERETKFTGVVFDIQKHTIRYEGDDNGEIIRELLMTSDAVMVVPQLPDGTLLMGREYRSGINEVQLGFPAGRIDEGETHLQAAKRELEEELGYKSDNLKFLFTIGSSIGITNEKIHIFYATDLVKSKTNFDHDEYVELEMISPEDALSQVMDGNIISGPTVAALLSIQGGVK